MELSDKLLTVKQVMSLIEIRSRCTIWKWVRKNKFPAPVSLNGIHIRWRENDVRSWMNSRPTLHY